MINRILSLVQGYGMQGRTVVIRIWYICHYYWNKDIIHKSDTKDKLHLIGYVEYKDKICLR